MNTGTLALHPYSMEQAMVIGTMTSKGQITIPLEVRLELGLEAGQQIEFEVADGKLIGHKVIAIRESDLWMTHPEVVAMVAESQDALERGDTTGPLEFEEFLTALDSTTE